MPNDSISKPARIFELSRNALLHYDRIGLLPSSGRSGAECRCYSEYDHAFLHSPGIPEKGALEIRQWSEQSVP